MQVSGKRHPCKLGPRYPHRPSFNRVSADYDIRKRCTERICRNRNHAVHLKLPVPCGVTQLTGAEKVNMRIAGHPVQRILEVMVFAVGERVRHILLACVQRTALVDQPAVALHRALQRQSVELEIGD